MATVRQCRGAITRLAGELDRLDPQLRASVIPRRTVSCRITDREVTFTASLNADGLHDLTLHRPAQDGPAQGKAAPPDIRVTVSSDELVAIADGADSLLSAWVQGRIQVSAPVRDLLRLRPLISL